MDVTRLWAHRAVAAPFTPAQFEEAVVAVTARIHALIAASGKTALPETSLITTDATMDDNIGRTTSIVLKASIDVF